MDGSPAGKAGAKPGKFARAQMTTNPPCHIDPAKLKLVEHTNNSWICVAPSGASPRDFHLNRGPFELFPRDVSRFDTLIIVDAGNRYWARFLCVDSGAGQCLFALLESVDLPPVQHDRSDRVPAGYEVVQGGPDDMEPWLVRRIADSVILNRFHVHRTREEAVRFLLDHPTVRGETSQGIWRGQ